MSKKDLKRLIKIENQIYKIADEELKLEYCPIEFDVVPDQKMFEIMAYNIPTNISNWKRGRDYERIRTMNENGAAGLPYEVVINSDPSRAYLMKSNPFAIQCLVMAHVVGHVAFFTMNKFFQKTRRDIVDTMYEAGKRINTYERLYGIDEVEKIVDAGHALQFHSSPFASEETEKEKLKRIYEAQKKQIHQVSKSQFAGIIGEGPDINEDINLFNSKLWRNLKLKVPVEPTDDLLRFVIDNSSILEDWQCDILELLRMEGRYYWPIMKTKFMNEGFATYTHQYIMNRLFQLGYLDVHDHSQYTYSNSLVKAENPVSLNPYLIGSKILEDIEDRWDKGRHGTEYNDCLDHNTKENWDTKAMKGREKIMQIVKSYTDWFFMKDYLTVELVKDLKLYIYVKKEQPATIDYVITKLKAKEVRDMIANSFAHSMVPKIEIVNGNHELYLEHRHVGRDLDKVFAEKTLGHLFDVWGKTVHLKSKIGEGPNQKDVDYKVTSRFGDIEKAPDPCDNSGMFAKTELDGDELTPF